MFATFVNAISRTLKVTGAKIYYESKATGLCDRWQRKQ